ncbi:MAG: 6-phosphogluconolactonase, partial [Gammaproteobacteria bacterium]|nr:6-phosphogluconolactonase [Gammaproteobacteria bacterium]
MGQKKQLVYKTSEELVTKAAQYIAAAAKGAITHHGGLHIALSGGRTPAHLYDYLAEKGKQLGIDW